ncbi:MAG: hypothetical protein ACJ71W_08870 [Terriglobales bacterium]
MWHEDLTYHPILETAQKAIRANARLKALRLTSLGQLYDEAPSNNTATQTVTHGWLQGDATKVLEFSYMEGMIGKVISCCQSQATSGTMVIPKKQGMIIQAEYVDHLETKNQQLEYRLGALESELKQFRPYMKTIQRMVDEYQAGTVRAQQIVRDLRANYQPTGAIERAAQRDLEVITEPIDWSAEEI